MLDRERILKAWRKGKGRAAPRKVPAAQEYALPPRGFILWSGFYLTADTREWRPCGGFLRASSFEEARRRLQQDSDRDRPLDRIVLTDEQGQRRPLPVRPPVTPSATPPGKKVEAPLPGYLFPGTSSEGQPRCPPLSPLGEPPPGVSRLEWLLAENERMAGQDE